jgi:hypothetical protein
MNPVPAPRRKGVRGIVFGLLFCFFLLMAPPLTVSANNAGIGLRAYKERAAAEQNSRSRYRRLEWASLVLILAAGGAAIFWAVRRRK